MTWGRLVALTWFQIGIRLFFLFGFMFIVGVGAWAIVMVTRMRREQTIAIATLNALNERVGLKKLIDVIQSTAKTEGDHK